MLKFTLSLLGVVRVFFLSRVALGLEILALRQQLTVFKRWQPRPRLNPFDRLFWTTLRALWSRWAEALTIVKPETVGIAPVFVVIGVGDPALARGGRASRMRDGF